MDSVLITSVLFLFFFSAFHSPSLAASNAPYKLVNDFCSQAKLNKTFCVEAFKSDPRSSSAPDYLTLGIIAIDLGIGNAKNTQTYISKMLKSRTSRSIKPALQLCNGSYGDIIGSFQSALDEMVQDKEYETANYDIFASFDFVGYCEQKLNSDKVRDSSLFLRNKQMRDFCWLAYWVTDILDRQNHPPSH